MDLDRTGLGWSRGEWGPFNGQVTFQPLACVQAGGEGRREGEGKRQEGGRMGEGRGSL